MNKLNPGINNNKNTINKSMNKLDTGSNNNKNNKPKDVFTISISRESIKLFFKGVFTTGLIWVLHVITFFLFNVYVLERYIPYFYDRCQKTMLYGFVEFWPMMKDPDLYLLSLKVDPISFYYIIVDVFIAPFVVTWLLISFIIDWFLAILHYWGIICYKILNFVLWPIPNWHDIVVQLNFNYFILFFFILYMLDILYILKFTKGIDLRTQKLLQYLGLLFFIIFCCLFWYTFIYTIINLKMFKLITLLYFICISVCIFYFKKYWLNNK